jgi:3-deoxy-manno-octulosonate cytidylyltransferase (CMP-KDO synthetase)
MKTICVIPARMAASRFPGKPLRNLLGMPLIQHVYFRCRAFTGFDRVLVATCDQVIADSISKVGGEVVMTADTHERATDRVEEAVRRLALDLGNQDLVLMVQGDEVLVNPEMLAAIVEEFRASCPAVVNLVSRLYSDDDHRDPNCVKAVVAQDRRILYLSRAPVPSRARAPDAPIYQQTGVIAFRADFLREFSRLPQTPLEKIESCDMMRVVEHGLPISAVLTQVETVGVDTEADRARAEKVLGADPLTKTYLERAQ